MDQSFVAHSQRTSYTPRASLVCAGRGRESVEWRGHSPVRGRPPMALAKTGIEEWICCKAQRCEAPVLVRVLESAAWKAGRRVRPWAAHVTHYMLLASFVGANSF